MAFRFHASCSVNIVLRWIIAKVRCNRLYVVTDFRQLWIILKTTAMWAMKLYNELYETKLTTIHFFHILSTSAHLTARFAYFEEYVILWPRWHPRRRLLAVCLPLFGRVGTVECVRTRRPYCRLRPFQYYDRARAQHSRSQTTQYQYCTHLPGSHPDRQSVTVIHSRHWW